MPTNERQTTQFLMHTQLPQRVARLGQRAEGLQRAGWDINTLQRQADDCALLAKVCGDLDADELGAKLEALHDHLTIFLRPPRLPDEIEAAHLADLMARLAKDPIPADADGITAPIQQTATSGRSHDNGFPLFVVAPEQHWLRLAAAARDEVEVADDIAPTDVPPPSPDVASEIDDLATLVRTALDQQGLELSFQPILSVRGDDEEQFQVLLRLRDAGGTLHTAADLVPAATRAGLMAAVDRWVLEACVQRIMQRSLSGRAPRLFLSQSIDSVRDADAPGTMRALLARHQVAGDALVLDLRVDDAALGANDTRRHVDAMRALGVHIALSGVEPGERSRRMLTTLDIDFAKLMPLNPDDGSAPTRAQWRALIEDLHERGIRVIAPRVEDASSAAALYSLGADFIQGNFVQAADAELAFDFQEQTVL